MIKKFKFIDLFAGLGGFHIAAKNLGGHCVFASEIDQILRENYHKNFGIPPHGDINNVEIEDIPEHDLLCAGFPCQPFSKAGSQRGWEDATRGTLFFVIAKIIEQKKPSIVILENVANFIKHDNGNTYRQVILTLEQLGYEASSEKISPHRFGIPQHRERMYIVASRYGLGKFEWPTPTDIPTHISSILEESITDVKAFPSHILEALDLWQEFLDRLPKNQAIPYFPLWSMEAKATYPLDKPIDKYTPHELWKFKGSYGADLDGLSLAEIKKRLPSHALRPTGFPKWKVSFINRNREFFHNNAEFLSDWFEKVKRYPSSLQKLEWNNKDGERSIWKHLVQIRASGIRVKRPDYAPALVSASDSQIPVVAWLKRYLSVQECARLQCMENISMPTSIYDAYQALGNAVNVKVVQLITENLLTAIPKSEIKASSVEAEIEIA
ncbi:DNA (cytosine-5-)-methyltransferase [Pseudomonas aeruginosa]|uniref:DNA (cytosine-5-)-methyltransferase n=1 Tax=Pseudomonas aeruginosa TaxID=287 RepID=UPI002AD5F94B|nr:DNA (cytosine-5-)-methyltransferase [Pseudomonas aeruginosa]